MAESTPEPDTSADAGAPIPKDQIDPDLIKLARARPKIGVITGAGVVIMCVAFVLRLNGDRTFAGNDTPQKATVADVVAGKVDADSYVSIELEPMMEHAIRAARNKTGVGLRIVPARGAGDKLWLVMNGDGWAQPTTGPYEGRLQELSDFPFYDAISDYADAHPRPVFAKASAVRAGLAAGNVVTVAGDTVAVADSTKVAIDVVDPNAALVVATFNERLPTPQAWSTAIAAAGLSPDPPINFDHGEPLGKSGAISLLGMQLRFEVKGANAVAETKKKLQTAELWAARVEAVTRHYETTWGALKASPATGFTVAVNTTIPDADFDLVGLYVGKGIPDGAYALITGDRPQQYWYVLPITIVLVLIGLLFAWVLVRAVKRDLLPTKAPGSDAPPAAA